MIVSAAFCPQAPALVEGVTGEAAIELDQLRSACDQAVAATVAMAEEVVVVGGADQTAWFMAGSTGTLASFGIGIDVTLGSGPAPAQASLPLSLTIGAWLLSRQEFIGGVSAVSIAGGYPPSACIEMGEQIARETSARTALLVIGDGTARRSEKAPGYVDHRAQDFDRLTAQALATGNPAGLLDLPDDLAHELMVAGRSSWQVAAAAMGAASSWDSSLLANTDPYGVMYFVARWLHRDAAS